MNSSTLRDTETLLLFDVDGTLSLPRQVIVKFVRKFFNAIFTRYSPFTTSHPGQEIVGTLLPVCSFNTDLIVFSYKENTALL